MFLDPYLHLLSSFSFLSNANSAHAHTSSHLHNCTRALAHNSAYCSCSRNGEAFFFKPVGFLPSLATRIEPVVRVLRPEKSQTKTLRKTNFPFPLPLLFLAKRIEMLTPQCRPFFLLASLSIFLRRHHVLLPSLGGCACGDDVDRKEERQQSQGKLQGGCCVRGAVEPMVLVQKCFREGSRF